MILVVDLVGELKGSLVNQLVRRKYRQEVFEVNPEICPHCLSKRVSGIEIMGAEIEGILLWECDKCDEIYLRFNLNTTEEELQIAKAYWTNSKDWGARPKSEYN